MTDKEYLKRDVVQQKEEMWCRLSTKGEIEFIDWAFVERQAAQFDQVGEGGVRDNVMMMCKLMVVTPANP